MAAGQVFTNLGRAFVTNRLVGAVSAPTYFIGWASGASALTPATPVVADTGFTTGGVSAGPEARVASSPTAGNIKAGTAVTGDTIQAVATVTASAARSVYEAGLFDASTAGNMLAHASFTEMALNTGEAIQFTFEIQFV